MIPVSDEAFRHMEEEQPWTDVTCPKQLDALVEGLTVVGAEMICGRLTPPYMPTGMFLYLRDGEGQLRVLRVAYEYTDESEIPFTIETTTV